ncbi:AraC family transcriptional regulator ligand-binding domain-containing protein [Nocardia sp. NPDC046763]|uniref:AraC family transcriptional regulator ligand-binding domain-containing protein n=1 Tax=Nocardia sp. NPDC046763 TaxID=3155256 RepID=UPI0033D11878
MELEVLASPYLNAGIGTRGPAAPRSLSAPQSTLANTVSPQVFRLVLDAAVRAGVPISHLAHIGCLDQSLQSYGLTRLPTADLHELWDVLARAAGREVGVRVAAAAEFGRLHVWDYLIRSASTLAQGFRDAGRFCAVVCDPSTEFRVVEDGALLHVTYVESDTCGPADIARREFVLALAIRRAREGFGEAAAPLRVDFAHPAPAHREYLVHALGTDNIHFDRGADMINFLNCEQPSGPRGYDPQLREILHFYAQSVIDRAMLTPALTWLDAFRAAVRETIFYSTDYEISLDAAAHRLAVSTRTLQRHLTRHGTTWRIELETARRELAVALLSDATLPIQSIARRLGYRDHTTLARAFHRWTGQSPTTYRRSLQPASVANMGIEATKISP